MNGLPRHLSGRGSTFYGVALAIVLTVVAVLITAQGWREKVPAFDLLTYIRAVHDLLATGALPEHGDTGSLGSIKPAGTAWLMLPSTLLFDDPRLAEYAGTALLHFATLLGLFLLARKYFGVWCALFAMTLYGLSGLAFFLAGSLWPNGRPEFFVWFVFLASEWVTRNDARFLAAAGAVWGLGMYVDMAITPAIFVLPVLWLMYRPIVRLRPLVVAIALVAIVWSPYLRFEAPRRFADIRSQLTGQYILPPNYADTWCNPTLTLREVGAGTDARAPTSAGRPPVPAAAGAESGSPFAHPLNAAEDRLLSNFLGIAHVPGRRAIAVLLMLFVAAAMLLASISGAQRGSGTRRRRGVDPESATRWAIAATAVAVVVYALARIPGIADALPGSTELAIQRVTKLVGAGGVAAVAALWGLAAIDRWLARRNIEVQTPNEAAERRLVAASLAVPWIILFVLAEADKPERFWWLWPLQVLFLSAFATVFLRRLGAPRGAAWALQLALAAAVIGNSFLLDRVDAWRSEGWSGREGAEVRVVDYVAERLSAEGRKQAAIGYNVFIYPFMAQYNITNAEYKVGSDFDLLFDLRRGVTNTNRCAEGLSTSDEYRIVRTRPMSESWAPRSYFDVPLDDRRFRLLGTLGPYQVFERRA